MSVDFLDSHEAETFLFLKQHFHLLRVKGIKERIADTAVSDWTRQPGLCETLSWPCLLVISAPGVLEQGCFGNCHPLDWLHLAWKIPMCLLAPGTLWAPVHAFLMGTWEGLKSSLQVTVYVRQSQQVFAWCHLDLVPWILDTSEYQ